MRRGETRHVTLRLSPNGPASGHKKSKVELASRIALGGQTESRVSSQVHSKAQKTETHFKTTCLVPRGQNADISSISLLSKLIQQQMDITQLVLFCGWWPNGEKLALTCVQIWTRPKWTKVNASASEAWPNGVASRPKFSTLIYLRLRLTRA